LPFILAHLSDAHIGPLPHARRRDLVGKRITGYINWKRGRSTAHDMDVLAAVVTDMRDQEPTHVAMTGDILNIGLPGEFPLAEAWLKTLGEPGSQVSFVAGNHDAYTRGSLPTLAALSHLGPKRRGRAPGYPYLKVRDGVALIGLVPEYRAPVHRIRTSGTNAARFANACWRKRAPAG
jgi:Predicted phosphohydrolases